jgi:hypothetical protein
MSQSFEERKEVNERDDREGWGGEEEEEEEGEGAVCDE